MAVVGSAFAQTVYVPSGTAGIGTSSNGNVGVGTSNPQTSFHVVGAIQARPAATSSGYVGLVNGSASYAGYIEWYKNGPARIAYLGYQDFTGSQNNLGLNLENGAQFVIGGGNVGIGTNTPSTPLTVKGPNLVADFQSTAASSLIYFTPSAQHQWRIGAGDINVNDFGVRDVTANSTRLSIDGVGNIGIGTTSPLATLHVNGGPAMAAGWNRTAVLQATYPVQTFNSNGVKWAGVGYDFAYAMRFWVNATTQDVPGTGLLAMSIDNTGNVGIGTNNQPYKFAVNGTIRAKEVIVDTGWSDYVFDEGYKLKALSETEAFVKTEKHLPGIPSAQQVSENGISIGEMQAKLLAKIEELTLHAIAQEKRMARIEAENQALREQVQEMVASKKSGE
jgi:hypothetical protein